MAGVNSLASACRTCTRSSQKRCGTTGCRTHEHAAHTLPHLELSRKYKSSRCRFSGSMRLSTILPQRQALHRTTPLASTYESGVLTAASLLRQFTQKVKGSAFCPLGALTQDMQGGNSAPLGYQCPAPALPCHAGPTLCMPLASRHLVHSPSLKPWHLQQHRTACGQHDLKRA